MTINNLINKSFESKSFNALSPIMKEAVNDIIKLCNEAKFDENILDRFDNIVFNVCKHHNVDRDTIEEYFDNELNEYLGEK